MKTVQNWAPPIVWMGVIFFLSGRESVHVSEVWTVNFLFFKTLHVIEYGILYALVYRAMLTSFVRRPAAFWGAFVIAIVFAISDEIHQTFVPTREGKLRDVIIDAVGAGITWYMIQKLLPKAPRKLISLAKHWQIV